MDFGLSDEQKLLDAIAAPLPRRGGAAAARARDHGRRGGARREAVGAPSPSSASLGVLVPEAHGGSGLALLDAALDRAVARLRRRRPRRSSRPACWRRSRSRRERPRSRREWLPRIATGEVVLGVALNEAVAKRGDAGVRVDGDRSTAARSSRSTPARPSAFLVALGARPHRARAARRGGAHASRRSRRSTARAASRSSASRACAAEWIGGRGAPALVDRVLAAGRVALAADMLGACERAIEMAVAYAKQRVQFGRADRDVPGREASVRRDGRGARAGAVAACGTRPTRSTSGPTRRRCSRPHAKAHLAEIGTAIVRTATEVHGGIGFTDEHDLHLWFKRAGLDRQLLGGPELVRAEAAALHGW